ncbi:MAG TPA: M28 family peptidase [Gemmatimonadaceae bacterium]
MTPRPRECGVTLRSLAAAGALALAGACSSTQAPATTASAAMPVAGPLPLKYVGPATGAPISAQDLMTRLYIYADDSLQGREAGTVGHMKATAYIADQVRRLGLVPAGDNGTYFQNVPFISRRFDPSTTLTVDGSTLTAFTDFIASPFRGALPRSIDGVQVVYGGVLGDTANALSAAQAAGKLVVLSPAAGGGRFFGRRGPNPLAEAAAVAIIAGPQLTAQELASGRSASLTLKPEPGAPAAQVTLYVTEGAATKLLGGSSDQLTVGAAGRTVQGNLRYITTDAPTRNVVAILPGSDPALRGEYVAIGAHSDHVGIRAAGPVDHDSLHLYNQQRYFITDNPSGARLTPEQQADQRARLAAIRVNLDSVRALRAPRPDSINNGADDDGSGTVTVLEVAEAFAKGSVKPKRSILFVWHTGEEKGLLGSRYFTDNPTVPRDSIVAQINIDMVGRGAAKDLAAGSERYLQLVGSRRNSTELGDLVETVNRTEPMPFTFDYTYDANGHPENIYCRSDHYEYARWGIPVVFLTTGLHGDYHQVTDEPQYIDYPHMARIGKLVFDLADRVADLDHRPVVDKPKPDPKGACRQ